MEKQEIINGLEALKLRLNDEVRDAYRGKGTDFAKERFAAWETALSNFFNNNCPTEKERFEKKRRSLYGSGQRDFESNENHFMRAYGRPYDAFIESLILDIKNDEYHFTPKNKEVKPVGSTTKTKAKSKKVFIVHGHDGETKYRTANFLRQHDLEPIILHLKASRNRTIIEKLEKYTEDVGYGIVLYTPDDLGQVKPKALNGELDNRARQNVIFEHGYLMGLIGRENVVAIVKGDIELPNDISGVVYIDDADWEKTLLIELRDAGYALDIANL
ncbi:MAG: nucleotide-binding protein [Shewanella sp.]|nr:nucleotide-binding protein [Shewanella sp.]